MKTFDYALIKPMTILKINKIFKTNPTRIFVKTDFARHYSMNCNNIDIYLTLLVKLGIVELVYAQYSLGNQYSYYRSTKGYRLK